MRISDWSSDVCSSDLDAGRSDCTDRCARGEGAGEGQEEGGAEEGGSEESSGQESACKEGFGEEGRTQRIGVIPPEAGISPVRSEEHTSELASLIRIAYAVCCLI